MAGKQLAKAFKTHEERFHGYFIRAVIVDRDADGYGRATQWEVTKTAAEDAVVECVTNTLTRARLWAMRAIKAEAKASKPVKATAKVITKKGRTKATTEPAAKTKESLMTVPFVDIPTKEEESESAKLFKRMRAQRKKGSEDPVIIPIEQAESI